MLNSSHGLFVSVKLSVSVPSVGMEVVLCWICSFVLFTSRVDDQTDFVTPKSKVWFTSKVVLVNVIYEKGHGQACPKAGIIYEPVNVTVPNFNFSPLFFWNGLFYLLNLDVSTVANRFQSKIKNRMADRVHLDETARDEPSHLDLHYLQWYVCQTEMARNITGTSVKIKSHAWGQ